MVEDHIPQKIEGNRGGIHLVFQKLLSVAVVEEEVKVDQIQVQQKMDYLVVPVVEVEDHIRDLDH